MRSTSPCSSAMSWKPRASSMEKRWRMAPRIRWRPSAVCVSACSFHLASASCVGRPPPIIIRAKMRPSCHTLLAASLGRPSSDSGASRSAQPVGAASLRSAKWADWRLPSAKRALWKSVTTAWTPPPPRPTPPITWMACSLNSPRTMPASSMAMTPRRRSAMIGRDSANGMTGPVRLVNAYRINRDCSSASNVWSPTDSVSRNVASGKFRVSISPGT
mmetsp:Transcript_27190/g.76416  ORF Transcript_27190/g.76416 Transcript_27190/m.76416 type:complete len:217 (+) Transcript_27190:387-1037(+)